MDCWCDEDRLPEETRCKMEAMKMMARWLLGLKDDAASAQKTFRMLTAFIRHRGDLLDSGRISQAEMSWLRLSAATSMLKICQQKGVGDQLTVDQFYTVSFLLADDVLQVREKFAAKLHRGLYRMPPRSLPLDFMGVYALAGTEPDKRIQSISKVKNIKMNLENVFTSILHQFYINFTSILHQFDINLTSILHQFYINYLMT